MCNVDDVNGELDSLTRTVEIRLRPCLRGLAQMPSLPGFLRVGSQLMTTLDNLHFTAEILAAVRSIELRCLLLLGKRRYIAKMPKTLI
jgi:hypothetical protein